MWYVSAMIQKCKSNSSSGRREFHKICRAGSDSVADVWRAPASAANITHHSFAYGCPCAGLPHVCKCEAVFTTKVNIALQITKNMRAFWLLSEFITICPTHSYGWLLQRSITWARVCYFLSIRSTRQIIRLMHLHNYT